MKSTDSPLHQLVSSIEKKFTTWLVRVILACTLFSVWQYKTELFEVTNTAQIGYAYSQSQYVLGDESPQMIDDGTLYIYAADAYFNGDDPTTINFEHPPLGKYVFGLSLWLFERVLALNILHYVLVLGLFASLLRRLKFSGWFVLLAVIYLGLGSSLAKHLRMALLDTQILIWTLSFFVALLHKTESWFKYGLLGVILGGLIATKYFFPIVFLFFGLLGIWAIFKRSWLKLLISILIAGSIYLFSYLAYFGQGHSLMDFLKFEWFRFKWWTGNRTIPKFIILQTILFGKFPMWWENSKKYQTDGDWNFSWPILFVGHLLALVRQNLNLEKSILLLYSLGILVIYLFGSAVYGRYLLQLIPFWIIIIGWALPRKLGHVGDL